MQNIKTNEHRSFILDVDGVLCESERLVHPEFKTWLMRWAKNRKVFLSTDNNFSQTLHLLGSYLCLAVTEVHHSCGNGVWAAGMEKSKSKWHVPAKAQAWIEFELRKSDFDTHATDRLENRPGMLYASIIGMTANQKEKAAYVEWDKQYSERQSIIESFNIAFPELTAHLSGDYGMSITDSGKNRGQLVTKLHSERTPIVYIGYNINNDSTNRTIVESLGCEDKRHSVSNWQEAWKLLKTEYA